MQLHRACGLVLVWACLASLFIDAVAASNPDSVTKDCPPLCAAVLKNDIAAAQALVAAGADVHAAHPGGQSSIAVAALKGNAAMVDLLRRHGGDLNRQEPNGRVPMANRAAEGDVDGIRLLHMAGASLDAPGFKNSTALYVAVVMKQISAVRVLLELGANMEATNIEGWTPLMTSAQCVPLAAQLLIEKGAALNHLTAANRVPMTIAASNGCLEVVKLLLKAGVDVDRPGADGYTPLASAADGNHLEVVQHLHGAGATLDRTSNLGTALYWSSDLDNTKVVEYLLEAGASVNVRTNNGVAPVHVAAKSGVLKVVQLLLLHGADINSRSGKGETPLISAAKHGHLDVVRHLLHAGAKHDGDKFGFTALHRALENKRFEVAQALLDAGFDVDSITLEKVTPLLSAAVSGRVDSMEWLLDRGANVDFPNKVGVTPLMLAAQQGHLAAAHLLVRRGANIDRRDDKGWSAIQYAEETKHEAIASYLVSVKDIEMTRRSLSATLAAVSELTLLFPFAAPLFAGVVCSGIAFGAWYVRSAQASEQAMERACRVLGCGPSDPQALVLTFIRKKGALFYPGTGADNQKTFDEVNEAIAVFGHHRRWDNTAEWAASTVKELRRTLTAVVELTAALRTVRYVREVICVGATDTAAHGEEIPVLSCEDETWATLPATRAECPLGLRVVYTDNPDEAVTSFEVCRRLDGIDVKTYLTRGMPLIGLLVVMAERPVRCLLSQQLYAGGPWLVAYERAAAASPIDSSLLSKGVQRDLPQPDLDHQQQTPSAAQRIEGFVAMFNGGKEMEALRGLLQEGANDLPAMIELGGVQRTREDLVRMLGQLEELKAANENMAAALLAQQPIIKDFRPYNLRRTRMELGRDAKPALHRPERIAQFKGFKVIITVTDPEDPTMEGWREYFGPYDISEVTCDMVMADVRAVHPRAAEGDWGLHCIEVGADIKEFEPIELRRYRSLVLCAAGIFDDCSGTVVKAIAPRYLVDMNEVQMGARVGAFGGPIRMGNLDGVGNVALKIFAQRSQLQREVDAFIAVGEHPNVARFVGYVDEPSAHWLLIEYLEAGLKREGLNEPTLLDWVLQLVSALKHVHSEDIVHNDVKPQNVMLDTSNCVKLVDFDSAAVPGLPSRAEVGTPDYMAPEQADAPLYDPIGPHTDVFLLCGTLYWLMTGVAPWEGYSRAGLVSFVQAAARDNLTHRPQWLKALQSTTGFQPQLKELILQGMHLRAAARPSLEQLETALRALVPRAWPSDAA